MKRQASTVILALLSAFIVPALGYSYLGALYAILFLIGYLGGFIAWLLVPAKVPWVSIKIPFWTTILAFLLLHKVEENRMAFFQVVSDRITGGGVPEVTIGLMIGLLVLPIGAWLITPFLIKRGHDFGYFLLWTLFVSMGITELAHFFLPFLTQEPYGYFPGMASVFVLAPLAWRGMWRLSQPPHGHANADA